MIKKPIVAGDSTLFSAWFVLVLIIALIIVGVVCICLYFARKRTIFRIDYAGGNIGFDMSWISQEEAVNFQRALRMCKDAENKRQFSPEVQNPANNSDYVSAPDELRKYYELLNQGIITQEDFEAKKKQLLGL